MKKLLFLTTLYIGLLTVDCFAQQNKIDSLLTVLKTSKEDTTKVNIYNALFLQYEFSDDEKAKESLNKAVELAQKMDYKKGLAATYSNLASLAKDKSNYPEALKKYLVSLKISEAIDDKIAVAGTLKDIGNFHYVQSDYPEALKNYLASLKIYETIGNKKGIAKSYNGIGNVYSDQGNYPKALKNYLTSLKIREAIGDKKDIAASYNNIGNIYYLQGNYPEALKNHFVSLKIKEEIGDKSGSAYSYNNIGKIYFFQGNYSEALKEFLASLKIRQALGDKKSIADVYSGIGLVYYAQGNYPEALKNHFVSLKIKEAIVDKAGIVASYGNIGKIFIKQKKYKEAKEYLLKTKYLTEEIGYKKYLTEVYSDLTKIDSAQGNFKSAYENHKLYTLYKDSLDNEETRKKTVQAQMTYDFEKKEAVTKLEQEKKDVAHIAESKQQRLIIYAVITGLILVLIFAFFLFRRFQITRQQKNIIEQQKNLVEQQKKEVEHQKHIVEEKNQEISSSVAYAKRIQRSFLTSANYIERYFPEHFILYKPKDVVSGDFYWMHQRDDYSYFCLADCTGHGIPGAFMSLIGMGILNEIVNSKQLYDTSDILNELRRIVILALNPEGATEEGKDGMDLVYLRIHLPSKELQYSAANNSFYICRKGELLEFKGDKMPVGSFGEYEKPFTQHTVKLEEGDIIYASTDGFPDQFGGPKGKKFKYKPLEELLINNANLPMEAQSERLNTVLTEWKGDLEQVDDVTVVGIKI